jgi:hypothetical protein
MRDIEPKEGRIISIAINQGYVTNKGTARAITPVPLTNQEMTLQELNQNPILQNFKPGNVSNVGQQSNPWWWQQTPQVDQQNVQQEIPQEFVRPKANLPNIQENVSQAFVQQRMNQIPQQQRQASVCSNQGYNPGIPQGKMMPQNVHFEPFERMQYMSPVQSPNYRTQPQQGYDSRGNFQ